MSTAVLAKTYGVPPLTNRDALAMLEALQALPQVALRDESPGIFTPWCQLASADTASPKLWMDAYLAAFAIAGWLTLVSLDRDFKNFVTQGLDLLILNP